MMRFAEAVSAAAADGLGNCGFELERNTDATSGGSFIVGSFLPRAWSLRAGLESIGWVAGHIDGL